MENNRDKYLWRENDNSSKTLTRYSLEGEHWVNSIKNATPNTTSFGEAFGFLGLLFSFVFNILQFVVLMLVELVKWIISVWPKKEKVVDTIPTFENRKRLTGAERKALIIEADKTCVIEEFDF